MTSFFGILEDLEILAQDRTAPSHVRAFSAWILGDEDALQSLISVAKASGQQRHPEHVAVLGYASAANVLSDDEKELLEDDLQHLAGRSYFTSGRPLRFEIDGIALLGVALATSERTSDTRWLSDLLAKAKKVSRDPWNLALITGAELALSTTGNHIRVPELAVALSARGLGALPEDLNEVWGAAMSSARPETADRAAARLATIRDLTTRASHIVPRAATLEDLKTVLKGTAHSLKRWPYGDRTPKSLPAKWEVDNEYNVQDFLWAVLAPVFPDLEDEEELPSLGPKHPRADLGIPKLRTIIEVKYMRSASQSERARMIEEIAADAGLYLSRTKDYDSIIAYIWDDAAQTEYHQEIRSGLLPLPGIAEVVIIPRPQKMTRSEPRQKSVRVRNQRSAQKDR